MQTEQCANCGAPIDNTDRCSYCKSFFKDKILNKISNMAFSSPLNYWSSGSIMSPMNSGYVIHTHNPKFNRYM